MKKKKNLSLGAVWNVLAAGIAIATGLGYMGRLFWIFDLFSHFRVQYFQISLVLIFIALWQRMHRRALEVVVLAGLNYALVLPLYFGRPAAAEGEPVRAMLMNLNAGNGNVDQVLQAIEQSSPDILLLEEVTPKWAAELAVLNRDYPYRIAEPQTDCFGMTLLSKYPVQHERVAQIGPAGVPSIITDIHLPAGVISFIGTHPVPPIGSLGAQLRNEQLAELPYVVMQQKHSVLLVGDLNVSPFSYWFRRVVTESGLKNSMKGFGFQPSWPCDMRLMRIPIDHVLHSEAIIIHNRMLGGDVGSDHLPVIVDFTLQ